MLSTLGRAPLFPGKQRPQPNRRPHGIVRIGSHNRRQLTRLFLSLDRSSRISRFGHPASDASLEAYADHALTNALFIAGATADDEILGAVEVFQVGSDGIAEVAFAVRAHWRRLGIATALFAAAKRWAESTDICILRMFVSRNNWPMRGLAEKVGGLLTFDLNEICVDVGIAAPPPAFWRN